MHAQHLSSNVVLYQSLMLKHLGNLPLPSLSSVTRIYFLWSLFHNSSLLFHSCSRAHTLPFSPTHPCPVTSILLPTNTSSQSKYLGLLTILPAEEPGCDMKRSQPSTDISSSGHMKSSTHAKSSGLYNWGYSLCPTPLLSSALPLP